MAASDMELTRMTVSPKDAKPGDYACWTVFRTQPLREACWAFVVGPVEETGDGYFAEVRIVAKGSAPTTIGAEFKTNLCGWGPENAVCLVFRECEVPDWGWAQIAKEQLQ